MSKSPSRRGKSPSIKRKGLLPPAEPEASKSKRKGLLPSGGQFSADPHWDVRFALRTRLSTAVASLVEATPTEWALKFLSERTDVDALISVVSQNSVAIGVAARANDPLRAAKSRASAKMAALMAAEGGPWGVERVAEHLSLTRVAVDKRRKSGTLIGVTDGGRAAKYPSWQFTSTGTLPGLAESLKRIGVSDPWMRMQFFLSPDPDLRATPLDALRKGRTSEVAAAASRYGREGEDA